MSTMEILENGRTYHSLPGVAFHVHYINFHDWSDVPFKHYQGVTICAWYVNSHERSDVPSDYCLSGARSSSSQLMLSDKHNCRVKLDFFTIINVTSSRDMRFHQKVHKKSPQLGDKNVLL